MNTDKRTWLLIRACVCLPLVLVPLGCKSPSAANIKLRKENQALRDQIEALKRASAADRATVAALQSSADTSGQLPLEKLDRLFTVAGIRLGRLTGVEGDSLRVQAVPIDASGQQLKAAGTFHIEAFDRSSAEPRKMGEWDFDLDEARKAWLGEAMQYAYLLTMPLSQSPAGEMDVRVTFRDELTGREFTESRMIKSGD